MSETLWQVTRYVDSLKERDAVKAQKERAARLKWAGGREDMVDHLFPTRAEAVGFMLQRAQKALAQTVAQVKKDQRRITKLRKKYL